MFPDEKHCFCKVKKKKIHALEIFCGDIQKNNMSYFKGIVPFVALIITSLWIALYSTNAATHQFIGNQSVHEAQVGRLYVNKEIVSSNSSNISNVTIVEVDKSVLPEWLTLSKVTHELSGVPLSGEEKEYNMVVTTVDAQGSTTTQRYTIMVLSSPTIQCNLCNFGPQVTIATIILSVDHKSANASERVRILRVVSKVFQVSTDNVSVRVTTNENGAIHICNKTKLDGGPGLGSNFNYTKFLVLSWTVDKNAISSIATLLSEKARNESVQASIGFPISVWSLKRGNTVLNCTGPSPVTSVGSTVKKKVPPLSYYYFTTTHITRSVAGLSWMSSKMVTSMITPSSVELSLTLYTQEISRTSRKSTVHISKTGERETMHTLAPEFTSKSVNQVKLGSYVNKPPKANHALTVTNVGVCNSIALKVPRNTFSDDEDGDTSNLTLYLASTSGERLGKDSWLYLNASSQVLYSVLSIHQIQTLKNNKSTFFLFARDRGGLSEKTEVRVALDKNQTNINYEVSIVLRIYYASNVSDAYLLYKLRSKIESYVSSTKESIYFVSFTRGTKYASMSLVSFSFCSLSQSSCDVSNTNLYSTKINEPSLKLALLPYFEVISVFEKRLGPCSEDRNEPPRLERPMKPLIINISYGLVTYVIPTNTFHDSEDGDTKNLTLSLLMKDMRPVGLNSWIQIKAQTIYALPATDRYREQPNDGYNFLVVATDSGKKFAIAHLQVCLQGNRINSPMYQINISAKSFYPTDTSTIFQIRYLTVKLGKYIGKTVCPNNEWHFVKYEKSSSYPAILRTTISTCTNTCDVTTVEYVFSKMFTPKETILDQLKQAVAPFFYIESVKLIRCTSSSQLVATFGRLFWLKVPEKIMSEMRDRGHKNITLSLQGPSSSNWLMLDKNVNVLYGIPLFTNFEYQNGSSVNYTLFTTEQDGKTTEHIFEVFITPGDFCSSTPSLVLTLNSTMDSFIQNPSRRVELVRKLTSFLGGNESDLFVRSVQGTKRNTTDAVLVGIVNDTTCGKFGASAFVDALVTDMMTPLGDVRSKLLDALSPFGVLDVFSRLPTAIAPQPNPIGAKIFSPPRSLGWSFVLFVATALFLIIVIGVWIFFYYKNSLKQKDSFLVSETTPKSRNQRFLVRDESEDLYNAFKIKEHLDKTDNEVKVLRGENVEPNPKVDTHKSNSYELYSNVSKLKNDHTNDRNKQKKPHNEKPAQIELADKSGNYNNSQLSFDHNVVLFKAENVEVKEKNEKTISPVVVSQADAPTYFLPPLLRNRVSIDSGVSNYGMETEEPSLSAGSMPSVEEPTSDAVLGGQNIESLMKKIPEKHRKTISKEAVQSPQTDRSSTVVGVKPSDTDRNKYPLDNFGDGDEKEPSSMYQPVLFRKSQKRQLPKTPPVPPLHRFLTQYKYRPSDLPPGSPPTSTP